MKINTYPNNLVQMFSRGVTEANADKQGGAGSNAFEQNKKEKDEKEEFEATIESVQKAIEDFSTNQTNLNHGISAASEGNGPGLRVVLKDAAGGILRSVSGEEFLKLKEAVSAGSKSGRILDQKV